MSPWVSLQSFLSPVLHLPGRLLESCSELLTGVMHDFCSRQYSLYRLWEISKSTAAGGTLDCRDDDASRVRFMLLPQTGFGCILTALKISLRLRKFYFWASSHGAQASLKLAVLPRMTLNSWSLASALWKLEFLACASVTDLCCAGDQTQDFTNVRQALCQLDNIPRPSSASLRNLGRTKHMGLYFDGFIMVVLFSYILWLAFCIHYFYCPPPSLSS